MSKATETENHACTLSRRAKKKSLKARPAKCKGRAPTARFKPRISVFCFVVWQPLLHGFSVADCQPAIGFTAISAASLKQKFI